ncbi:hypothetical protein [Enterococcus sp. HY326]|uniref:hypothetical protein n=1 Tax=Enterococcus sp. HY326 TaxID=2971265 RepID=UPI0022401106|nr:hypothetical protein [Enterococcus sp. HY326]
MDTKRVSLEYKFRRDGLRFMCNDEHEINCPDNFAIRKFLWEDYFHDSRIMNLEIEKSNNKVILTLESNTDLNDDFEKLKLNNKEFWEYVSVNIAEYTYDLVFIGVKHVQIERSIESNDYIEGRFKNTALVNRLKQNSKEKLYHFRIKVTDGFIDIIFSDFSIRRMKGKVSYEILDSSPQHVEKSFNQLEMVKSAKQGDDFERYEAMKGLYETGYVDLLNIARCNMILTDDFEESCLYACFLIGLLGNQDDLSNLLTVYHQLDLLYKRPQYLKKRAILDAIEKVQDRDKER